MGRARRAVRVGGFEEAAVGGVHGLRAGERGQVRRALRRRLALAPARHDPEHERAEHDGHEAAEEHDRGLPALARCRP